MVENPSDEEGVSSFADNLNPNSLQVIEGALIENDVASAKPGDVFQFMRQGYFAIDPDSTSENIIINRTVALKDSFNAKK
jgi:glutaminyl-tRNA synthetase